MKITKGFYFLLAFFAIAIGLYPLKYLLMGFHFDSMDAKNNEWVASIFWDISFYTHITFGGIALLIGWVQFSTTNGLLSTIIVPCSTITPARIKPGSNLLRGPVKIQHTS